MEMSVDVWTSSAGGLQKGHSGRLLTLEPAPRAACRGIDKHAQGRKPGRDLFAFPIAYEKPWVLPHAYRCLSVGHCIAIADRIVQENVERAPLPLEIRYPTGFTVLDSCGEVAQEEGTVWSMPPTTPTPAKLPVAAPDFTGWNRAALFGNAPRLR
jgi:hypothetical protein